MFQKDQNVEAASFSKTLVPTSIYHSTWHDIPEVCSINILCFENLRSQKSLDIKPHFQSIISVKPKPIWSNTVIGQWSMDCLGDWNVVPKVYNKLHIHSSAVKLQVYQKQVLYKSSVVLLALYVSHWWKFFCVTSL